MGGYKSRSDRWSSNKSEFWSAVLFLVSAKVLILFPGEPVLLGWLSIWVAFIFFSEKKVGVTIIICSLVFFEQSLWFYRGDDEIRTFYEMEVLGVIKPIEVLIYSSLTKLVSGREFVRIPQIVRFLLGGWLVIVVISAAVGMLKGTSVYDMFIFSEFRTLMLGFALYVCIYNAYLSRPGEFLEKFVWLVFAKTIITLPDYFWGVSILWPASVANYAGTSSAFYGGDDSVYIALFAFALLISTFNSSSGSVSGFVFRGSYVLRVVLSSLILATVVLSMRRGGILALLVCFCVWFVLRKRGSWVILLLGGIGMALLVSGDVILGSKMLPNAFYDIADRFLGKGQAYKSNLGHTQDLADGWEEVKKHLVLGKGLGARIESNRALIHGADVQENIYVHQAHLHSWLKFGLAGLFFYVASMLMLIQGCFKRASQAITSEVRILFLVVAGLMAGKVLWEFFTPPYYQSFRVTGVYMCILFLISVPPVWFRVPPQEVKVLSGRRGNESCHA